MGISAEEKFISANALIEKIMSSTVTVVGLRNGKRVLLELLVKYREGVLQVIKEQPAVDAVTVVHCKECVFSKYFEESGTRKCRAQNGLYRTIEDSDFCSYGERKEYEQSKEGWYEQSLHTER